MAGNSSVGAAILLVTSGGDEHLAEQVFQGGSSYRDVIHERMTNQVMKAIKPGDFLACLKEVAERQKFPDTVVEQILSGGENVYEFCYCKLSHCDVKILHSHCFRGKSRQLY